MCHARLLLGDPRPQRLLTSERCSIILSIWNSLNPWSFPVATSRADLILHPVRMRLLVALARRQLTTRQLSARLPDVAQATLYHHLGLLTRAGLLRVVSQRPVRGTLEKRYALVDDTALLSPADL